MDESLGRPGSFASVTLVIPAERSESREPSMTICDVEKWVPDSAARFRDDKV